MKKRGRPSSVGLLSDDVAVLARRIYEDLVNHDCVVWAQDGYFCRASPEQAPPLLPSHLIAGTFRFGVEFETLTYDLKYLRDTLLSNIMIESGELPPMRTVRRRASRRTAGPRA
jgi:hypothetical protein